MLAVHVYRFAAFYKGIIILPLFPPSIKIVPGEKTGGRGGAKLHFSQLAPPPVNFGRAYDGRFRNSFFFRNLFIYGSTCSKKGKGGDVGSMQGVIKVGRGKRRLLVQTPRNRRRRRKTFFRTRIDATLTFYILLFPIWENPGYSFK